MEFQNQHEILTRNTLQTFWAQTRNKKWFISQTNSHYNLHQGTVGIATCRNIDLSEYRPVGI